MSYQELIAKALNGRSVNRAAKDFGVPQKTLDRYTKGERLPDYYTAWRIAQEAGMDPAEVFALLAEEEAKRKGSEWTLSAITKSCRLFRPPADNKSVVKLRTDVCESTRRFCFSSAPILSGVRELVTQARQRLLPTTTMYEAAC